MRRGLRYVAVLVRDLVRMGTSAGLSSGWVVRDGLATAHARMSASHWPTACAQRSGASTGSR
jgi:hypothetical protein